MLGYLHTSRLRFQRVLLAALLVHVAAVCHVHGAEHDATGSPEALSSCVICALGAAQDDEGHGPRPSLMDGQLHSASSPAPTGRSAALVAGSAYRRQAPRAPPAH